VLVGLLPHVVEQAFQGTPRQLPAKSRSICVATDPPTIHRWCVHGLGHGLMIHTDYVALAARATSWNRLGQILPP
jgi:hypothetical protein